MPKNLGDLREIYYAEFLNYPFIFTPMKNRQNLIIRVGRSEYSRVLVLLILTIRLLI